METSIMGAIEQICLEKNLAKEKVLEAIEQALAAAYRKDFGEKNQNIKVEFNPVNGAMKIFDIKTVVEDSLWEEFQKEMEERKSEEIASEEEKEKKRFNPRTDIALAEARKIKKSMKLGDEIKTELSLPEDFGRVAAQTAKQVIIQRLREAERQNIFDTFKNQEGKVINGVIQRRESNDSFVVDLNSTTAILPPSEQVREEKYYPGQKLRFYIAAVNMTPRGPEIITSRRHSEIVKELFRLEIPEINSGVVEIKGIAREAGLRSKVAVVSNDENIDPIGSCIGQKGVRIQTIINELSGEKIDIIEYSEDQAKFISNALAPAKATLVILNEDGKKSVVSVKENQFSLAIGRDGQNVRLAARLTGWAIEVVKDSETTGEGVSANNEGEIQGGETGEPITEIKADEPASPDASLGGIEKEETTETVSELVEELKEEMSSETVGGEVVAGAGEEEQIK
ncbi:MAG: transcription termination factor NusA [Patescibacteria group bacterium]